jgi:hypothetical protein
MSFSYQDLAQRAGVDPWGLRDKLAAGDPAEINQLAQAFAATPTRPAPRTYAPCVLLVALGSTWCRPRSGALP